MSFVEKVRRIFTKARVIVSVERNPVLQIPLLEPVILEIPESDHRHAMNVEVDLGKMTCGCERWRLDKRELAPATSIARCCTHMVKPVYQRICLDKSINPWTLAILEASYQYPPPVKSEMAIFSNGIDDYLAFYDLSRGYIQLYGPLRSCEQYGYELQTNRWGWGDGPENPMAIKKQMRPWAKALDKKYGHEAKFGPPSGN